MNTIITIGREFGSGGREIGSKLAEKYGIPFYDKELLEEAAKHSGICEELFVKHDESCSNSFLYSLVMGTYPMTPDGRINPEMPLNHRIFLAQFETIKKLATGPCVIVGRCADYILRDRADCLKVFIHRDFQSRAERIVQVYGETEVPTEKRLKEKDKRRAAYYQFYTDQKWADLANYHIVLDSGVIGIEKCIDIIADLY